ncbi:MAG: methyltransferase domain-containing protein [Lachnospiraceae bacterium]|nr:methyltransferase domain-containing protein [Lachnospiraceae bacterium]
MEAYTGFSEVYDTFMDNVPYSKWGEYIIDILKEYGITNGILCEIGCGTGKMTKLLSDRGYDMIGIDSSADMLDIAHDKRGNDGKILYLNQDMKEMELYGTVRAFVSCCDSVNYLLSGEELLTTFKLVNNYLDPKGLFIFDMNTTYKYKELLADNVFAENRDDASFIWENFYDEDEKINEYDLTLFVKEDELYRKYEEVHYQKAYDIEEVEELIEKSGLKLLAVYDAYTRDKVREDSERVIFIAQEITKEAK